MNALIPFPNPNGGLPPHRDRLRRHMGELGGLANERVRLLAMEAKLEGDLAKFENAGLEVDRLLNAGAQSLLDKLRAGVDPVIASLGGKAADLDARRAVSMHSAEIVRRAIGAIRLEVANTDDKIATLNAQTPDLQRAVVNEGIGGALRAEHAEILDRFRESLVNLAALERFLAGERHDWAPPARVVVEIPDLVWGDAAPMQVVLAPGRAIRSAEKVIAEFQAALTQDPLAPAPTFAPVDPTPDANTLFHELSLAEMADVTRNAAYSTRQRDDAPEPRSFVDTALAAIGIA
jgi:hypothetical protein